MGVRPVEENLDFDVGEQTPLVGTQIMNGEEDTDDNVMGDAGSPQRQQHATFPFSTAAREKDYDGDCSNGEAQAADEGMAMESGDEEEMVQGWPGLNSSGHEPSWLRGRDTKKEAIDLRRHSMGSAGRDAEFGLTIDDRNQLVGNRLAAKIYTNAQQVIASLKTELQTHKAEMEDQANTLAAVLQQQTLPQGSWQEKSSSGKGEYENLYHAQLKQNDALTLEMVKLRSQLDEARRTARTAVAAIRGSPLDENMGDLTMATDEGEARSEAPSGGAGLGDIASLLQDMSKKMQINAIGCEIEAKVVLEFLAKLREQKMEAQAEINGQLLMISTDMTSLEQQIKAREQRKSEEMLEEAATNAFSIPGETIKRAHPSRPHNVLGKRVKTEEHKEEADKKKNKIITFLDDLQSAYFDESTKSSNRLQAFSRHLSTFTKYTYVKTLRALGYQPHETQEKPRESSLVSSIKLDRNEEFFAVGGLLREIQLFPFSASELESATSMITEELSPVQVMSTDHSIANMAWSHHSRGQLAAADYDGVVKLWDCHSGTLLTQLVGHSKGMRVWGVDYSSTKPGTLASASEDNSVRIWDVSTQQCALTIPTKAAVCCVKFHPTETKVAFGTSGSKVLYYDLRMTDDPLAVFNGHQKPVCGVDFLNSQEMVTQAVDSTLKLWKLSEPRTAIRTFQGHYNAKRFTGLTARNEFIMCGSEDNAVVVYNKMITTPFLRDSFDTGAVYGGSDDECFASAVEFNKHANIILAGNSKGVIKIMKLM